jgi:hypothetical protein
MEYFLQQAPSFCGRDVPLVFKRVFVFQIENHDIAQAKLPLACASSRCRCSQPLLDDADGPRS